MNAWENDPYELPILKDATYRCSCGCAAYMDRFFGGPAYAHHWYYAIKCRESFCPRSTAYMRDWKDTPAEAIRVWNRRCRGGDE